MSKTIVAKKNTAIEVNHSFRRPTGDAPTITGTPTYDLRKTGASLASGNLTADSGTKYYAAFTTPNAEGVSYTLYASLTADGISCEEEIATIVTADEDVAGLADLTAAIKSKTDNLPEGIKKNTALNNFECLMRDSGDHVSPKTGLTVTAQRSIDGGAFAACANSVTEVGSGIYKLNLAASDLNGDIITLMFGASGADARYITIKTEE